MTDVLPENSVHLDIHPTDLTIQYLIVASVGTDHPTWMQPENWIKHQLVPGVVGEINVGFVSSL